MDFERRLFSLEVLEGLFEQWPIRAETDGPNVAVLLASEKVPRAAQFQVKRCDLEPCTEVGKLAQRGEAFSRHFAELGVHRHQQVRVRAAVGTPHATSQLI